MERGITSAKQRRTTAQRQLVLDEVRSRRDHPSADDIYLSVRASDEHISRGTVYRNLNLLAEDGEIGQVKVPGADRFDLRPDPHSHILCSRCGRVEDVPIPYDTCIDAKAAQISDYSVSRHLLIFEGVCPDCAGAEK